MHEYGPILLLFVGILGGIWLNRRDFSDLKADMNRQFAEAKADTNRQLSEMRSETSRQFSDLRSEVHRQFTETNRRLDLIEGDLKSSTT